MSRAPTIKPEALLLAAMRVILADGMGALTIDAVARAAGVSKGGVLYHFPSKDELLKALVEHCMLGISARTRMLAEADPHERGRTLRAFLATHKLDDAEIGEPGLSGAETERLYQAMFAAVVNHPPLLEIVQRHDAECRRRLLAESGDPVEDWVTLLAIDGLALGHLLGFQLPLEIRDAVLERLLRRTFGANGSDPRPDSTGVAAP